MIQMVKKRWSGFEERHPKAAKWIYQVGFFFVFKIIFPEGEKGTIHAIKTSGCARRNKKGKRCAKITKTDAGGLRI